MPNKTKFDFDVFISYSHQDKEWVRNVLLPRLENGGLKVFIDFRDFRVGAATIKEIERGITNSRKTIMVLTQEYLKSDWAEFETLITQTLSPANRDLRLVPILRKECDLPVSIRYLTYVNLIGSKGRQMEWKRLFDALSIPPSLPKLLLVDDESDVQKTIGGYLNDAGYEVCLASDEDEAFQILAREPIDIAIIDIQLHESRNDESGLALANAIHALAPQIKTIILSGSDMPTRIIRAFKDFGVVDYILKTPDMGENLLETIKEYLVPVTKTT
jgi:CheY-like chemotaxis protein